MILWLMNCVNTSIRVWGYRGMNSKSSLTELRRKNDLGK
jgi:hypothetical protein